MNGETTEILRSFSIDGPIAISTAIAVGITLAVLFAILLFLERRALGRFWGGLFLCLRMGALCLVLVMLLGPSWVTRHRTTRPQAIAVLVDTSDSMDVSDPPEAMFEQRWASSPAIADDTPDGGQAMVERAIVAVRMASQRIREAQEALERHQPVNTVRQRMEVVQDAVTRATAHLESGRENLASTSDEAAGRIDRLLQLLEGRIAADLRHLTESVGSESLGGSGDLWESLQSIADSLDTAERRTDELLRHLNQQNFAGELPGGGGLSRKEHVASTLSAVDESAEESVRTNLTVKRMGFDRQATFLPQEKEWQEVLLETGLRDVNGEPPRTSVTAALDLLARTAATESIRSAILITDGAHNDNEGQLPQEVAGALGNLPVHVIPIGRSEELRDVILYRADAPKTVVENDSILIDVIVTAFQCAGEGTTIVLRKDGRQIDERPLHFDRERGDQRISFDLPAEELGRFEFELAIEPLKDEASTTNNVAQLTVDVVKETLNVLLADRIARWEYRYLDQLLRRDETVRFDRILFHPEPTGTGELAQSGGLPRDLSTWADYDVVILGDMETSQLDERSQESLAEYVRTRGGNLVLIAGNESMPHRFTGQPLMDLLPVERAPVSIPSQGLTLAVTSAGKSHPALAIGESPQESQRIWKEQFQSLPIYSLSDYSRPKPTAESLIAIQSQDPAFSVEAEQDGSPAHSLLTWHRVGAGRVAYIASPATYRLRFRRGDYYHHRFWGQLLRWMTAAERSSGTQTVKLATDRIRYVDGDRVDVIVRLADAAGDPVPDAAVGAAALIGEKAVTQIDLTHDEKVPGRYFGTFSSLAPGAYRIVPTGETVDRLLSESSDRDVAETRILIAESESPELADTRSNPVLLRQIAEITGGQVLPPTAIGELLALSAVAPEINERIERQPLWNRWSWLGAAFACLCTEWVARKRLGLV